MRYRWMHGVRGWWHEAGPAIAFNVIVTLLAAAYTGGALGAVGFALYWLAHPAQ